MLGFLCRRLALLLAARFRRRLLRLWLGSRLFCLRLRFWFWLRLRGRFRGGCRLGLRLWLRLGFWLGCRLWLGFGGGRLFLLGATLARGAGFRRFAFLALCLHANERQCQPCITRRAMRQRQGAQRRGCHEQADGRACENPWLAFHRWKFSLKWVPSPPKHTKHESGSARPGSRIDSGHLPDTNKAISRLY